MSRRAPSFLQRLSDSIKMDRSGTHLDQSIVESHAETNAVPEHKEQIQRQRASLLQVRRSSDKSRFQATRYEAASTSNHTALPIFAVSSGSPGRSRGFQSITMRNKDPSRMVQMKEELTMARNKERESSHESEFKMKMQRVKREQSKRRMRDRAKQIREIRALALKELLAASQKKGRPRAEGGNLHLVDRPSP